MRFNYPSAVFLLRYRNKWKTRLFRFIIVAHLCDMASSGQAIPPSAAAMPLGFRAAAVKVDITPEDSQHLLGYGTRKSKGVYNRIFHRIVILDDGISQFILVSTEICIISPAEYERVLARISSRFGIPPSCFWWATTHTHSAPEVGEPSLDKIFLGERYQHSVDTVYTALVEQKIIDGIEQARRNLVPAQLGVGWGFAQANINRRAIDSNGKAFLGMNPDGAVDRRIGLVRIDRLDGTPLALIANYPLHGTVFGDRNLEIIGDAPGIVAEYVEQQMGGLLLFINGAAGNLAPIYSTDVNARAGRLEQFRVLLGDKILSANHRIFSVGNSIKLKTGVVIVETPRKHGLGWPTDLNNYARATSSGLNLVRIPIHFLKINDEIVIWSAPLELFCEIANTIRDRSPSPFTFYFGYVNGWLGYMLPALEYRYGGYEVSVSPYTPEAANTLIEAVAGYLQGEMQSEQGEKNNLR